MTNQLPSSRRGWRSEQTALDAALGELLTDGWAGLVPNRVAARSGLSITPIRSRFQDRTGIAVALWQSRLADPLLAALSDVVAVVGQPAAHLGVAVPAALTPFVEPPDELQAAVELVIATEYEPLLANAVRIALEDELNRWLMPHSGATTRSLAAQRASLLSLALGLAVAAPLTRERQIDMRMIFQRVAAALSEPAPPTALPKVGAEHLDRGFAIDSGDPTRDALLRATLETVSEVGYEAATVERIVRRSGFTQGALFRRYSTKFALFLDATQRFSAAAVEANSAMMARITPRRSAGIAEAFYIRESMSPGRRLQRVVLLEQLRLARTREEIRSALEQAIAPARTATGAQTTGSVAQSDAAVHTEIARGNGPALLAVLAPTAWSLPHDVVTVPWQRASPT